MKVDEFNGYVMVSLLVMFLGYGEGYGEGFGEVKVRLRLR